MDINKISDAEREIGVVLHFLDPTYGIPCVVGWDQEGKVLLFDFEDYDEAVESYSPEVVDKVREWCMRNPINCYSEHQANNHLAYLGIKGQF